MPPQNRRIFISATNRDLQTYRELATKSLRKRGYEVDDESIFDLSFLELVEMLEHRIAKCDAVICLIGVAYGGEPSTPPPDQPRRSYTQWEYHIALELNKPVYRLVADENTPFDPPKPSVSPEVEELRQLQLNHRAEATRNRDSRQFNSRDQLRAELAELCFPWPDPPARHQPNNLPLATIGNLFKGRDGFLETLHKKLAASGAPASAVGARVAVHGLGGIGKTRVAIEYAWRHAVDYTALLFVSAPSSTELHSNLGDLVKVLQLTAAETSIEAQSDAVLLWLNANPGWLLTIDSVDTEETAQAVEDLLPKLRSGHILITSRITNWAAGVEPVDLNLLPEPDAVAFLMERTPHRRQTNDDVTIAAALAHELHGLALMLEQAGANIDKARLSFAEYLARWQANREDVLRWHDSRLMNYPASVAVTWETTLAQLNSEERRLLDVLSWLAPDPIPLFLFHAKPLLAAIPDVRTALATLSGYSLARFDISGNAVLVHRLVQEITRGRILADDRITTLQLALESVNDVAVGDPQDVRSWPIWQPLAVHVKVASQHADNAGLPSPTAGLMSLLGVYRLTRGEYREAEPLMRRVLSINEATYGPDHTDVAAALNNLASLLKATNRLSEAEPLMRRALSIYETHYGRDHPDIAPVLTNLAQLLKATNRLFEAEPLMREALRIGEATVGANHHTVATRINNLAQLLQAMHRMSEAEALMWQALSIDEASFGPDHPRVARDLDNLAQLLQATNRLFEAEPLMRRALSIDEASYGPYHPAVARHLNNLGSLLRITNRLFEAEDMMRRSVSICLTSYGADNPNLAAALTNLALLLHATKRLPEAGPLYRRAAQILIDFTKDTGHEHPKLQAAIKNFRAFLEAQRMTPEQIDQAVTDLHSSRPNQAL